MRWARENWRLMAFGVGALTISLVAFAIANRAAGNTERIGTLDRQLSLNACERVQRVREDVNGLAAITWLTLNSSAIREIRLAGRSDGHERGVHRTNAHALRRLMARLRYQPPTDCLLAFAAARFYQRPPPRRFTAALADHLTR